MGKGDKETIKELLFFYGDVSAISHLIQYQRKNYR